MSTILKKFKEMDEDGDRQISKKEFLAACKDAYLCPVRKAKKLFYKIDTDSNGKLSWKEFRTWMDENGGAVKETLLSKDDSTVAVQGKELEMPPPTVINGRGQKKEEAAP